MRGRINISGMSSISRVNNSNESYENQRLVQELEGDDPREAFVKALRAYAACDSTARKARLVEAVIRTSRGIADDDGLLQRAERRILSEIKRRYWHFGTGEETPDPTTYREARATLKELFF